MKEIDEIQSGLARIADQCMTGRSKYPGMTFEEGIRIALEWVLDEEGEIEDPTLE